MKLTINFDLSTAQVVALLELASAMGYKRSTPHAEWTNAERAEACKWAIIRLIPEHKPVPLEKV